METSDGNLLLVDDNAESLASLEFAFSRSNYRVFKAPGGREALRLIQSENIDVLVTDLRMPEVDGVEVLRRALEIGTPPTVIVLTAFGTVESAVNALRMGAFHYLTKPVDLKELRSQVAKAMERQRRRRESAGARAKPDAEFGFEGVVGQSAAMLDLMNRLRMIANSRSTVLLTGESGTGKELVARAIHRNSPRSKRAFVAVHCAAVPESLLESDLFGHEKGAFTGAVARKPGRFEQAHGGTMLLDEIGEIAPSIQVKLLRVIEGAEFSSVGGVKPIQTDVRIIAATNRNLEAEVECGAFREDLFYRLNVVRLHVPPLRDRRVDIPDLTQHFVEQFADENKRETPEIAPEVIAALSHYDWPGNVRELHNVIENMMVFLDRDTLGVEHLPPQLTGESPRGLAAKNWAVGQTLEQVEGIMIRETLDAHGGNRTRAAETLGISRRTLQRKIKELGLAKEE